MLERLVAALPAVLLLSLTGPVQAAGLHVAAAPSAQEPLTTLARAFTARSGEPVAFTFASSGKIAAQIAQGAPFDAFFAADATAPAALASRGLVSDRRPYARGRLVLWALKGSGVDVRRGLALLADPHIAHVAVANAALAPYGRAAEEALLHAGLLERVAPRFVVGENVAQAAQFVASGAAPVGLVSLSIARAPGLAGRGVAWTVPAAWHSPLIAEAAVVTASPRAELARRFLAFATDRAAAPTWARHGFEAP